MQWSNNSLVMSRSAVRVRSSALRSDEFLDAKQKYDEERESASTSITVTH